MDTPKCTVCFDQGTIHKPYSYDDLNTNSEYCLACELGESLRLDQAQEKEWRRRIWQAITDLMKPLEPEYFSSEKVMKAIIEEKNNFQLLHKKLKVVENWALLNFFEREDFKKLNETGTYYTDQEKWISTLFFEDREKGLAFIRLHANWGVEVHQAYWEALDNLSPICSIWDLHCSLFNYVFNKLPAYASHDVVLEISCKQLKQLIEKWKDDESVKAQS